VLPIRGTSDPRIRQRPACKNLKRAKGAGESRVAKQVGNYSAAGTWQSSGTARRDRAGTGNATSRKVAMTRSQSSSDISSPPGPNTAPATPDATDPSSVGALSAAGTTIKLDRDVASNPASRSAASTASRFATRTGTTQ